MESIELNYRGNFTQDDFEKKIEEAKKTIIKNNNLAEISFNQVRYSHDIGITIGNETFSCQYITYGIIENADIIVGYLNCLMNSQNTFINISSNR